MKIFFSTRYIQEKLFYKKEEVFLLPSSVHFRMQYSFSNVMSQAYNIKKYQKDIQFTRWLFLRTQWIFKEIKQYHKNGVNKGKSHALSRILIELKCLLKLSWFMNQNMLIVYLEHFAYIYCSNTRKDMRMIHWKSY